MSSTSRKIFKQLEKEVAKESKTEEQRLNQAMKDLSVTEKQQVKAHKAVLKAESKLAKVNKKESAANAALMKATQKHDTTATSVQHAERKLQDRKDADTKLQQEIDAKKARIQTAVQSQKNNELSRTRRLKELRTKPGVAGGESAPVPGHSTGFAMDPAEQAGQGDPNSAAVGQTGNFAADQPMPHAKEASIAVPQLASNVESGPGMTSSSAPQNTDSASARGDVGTEARDNLTGSKSVAHDPNYGPRSGQNLADHDPNTRGDQNLSTHQQGMQGHGYSGQSRHDPDSGIQNVQNMSNQHQGLREQSYSNQPRLEPNSGIRGGQNISNQQDPSYSNQPHHDPDSGIRGDSNISTQHRDMQGHGYSDQPQAMHGQNLSASQANPYSVNQNDDMSRLRGQANPAQSSPLATNEPISNIGRNAPSNGAGPGQSQFTQNPGNIPGSGSTRETMRQTDGVSPPGGRGSGPTSSHYGTPPENPGGIQGAREANLAGIGAGGTGSSGNASAVPAGGVTHPVTGDTVRAPQAGLDNMAKTGGRGTGGVGDGASHFSNVAGGVQNTVTSDIVDRALAGDTKIGGM